jgi:hypothetical protein
MLVDVRGDKYNGVALVHRAYDGGYDIESFIITAGEDKIKLLSHEIHRAEEYGFDTTEIMMRIEEEFDSLD